MKNIILAIIFFVLLGFSYFIFSPHTKNDQISVSPTPAISQTKDVNCTSESREESACEDIYAPVCAIVNIQCIKTPCNPINQTYSNACEACKNSLVAGYSQGECEAK